MTLCTQSKSDRREDLLVVGDGEAPASPWPGYECEELWRWFIVLVMSAGGFVVDVTILAARIPDAWSLAIRFITRSIKHYSRYVGIKRPKRCADGRCQHLN